MADFTFQVGSLDLTDYVRVQPGEGLEPYDPDAVAPAFTDNPIAEGGQLTNERVSIEERVFPLIMNNGSVPQLRALEQQLNRELARTPLQVLWKPPGGTHTIYDLEAGRFEPNYNYYRDRKGWNAGQLRLWTQPYGHGGTQRVVATAAGTGAAMVLLLPSPILGDVSARPVVRLQQGSQIGPYGRVLAVAALPDASYRALIPAASLNAATVIGASGAHASQYARMRVLGANPEISATFSMGAASLYAGRSHRILAVARGDYQLYAVDHSKQIIGPGAVASVSRDGGWGVVDLGVWHPPRDPALATITLGLAAGPASYRWHQAAPSPFIDAVQVTAVFVAPEDSAVVVLDKELGLGDLLDSDSFDSLGPGDVDRPLTDTFARLGGQWALPPIAAMGSLPLQLVGASQSARAVMATTQEMRTLANTILSVPSHDLAAVEALFSVGSQPIFGRPSVMVGVHVCSASAVLPGGTIFSGGAVELIGNGSGAVLQSFSLLGDTRDSSSPATGVFLSSRALNSFKLTYPRNSGGNSFLVQLEAGGSVHASIMMPGGAAAPADLFGVQVRATTAATGGWVPGCDAVRAVSIPKAVASSHLPNDRYVVDEVTGSRRRETAASVWSRDLAFDARGGDLRLGPGTAAAVAVLAMPFDEGIANDTLAVEVSAGERFRFAR
jgi:hypothetical protein